MELIKKFLLFLSKYSIIIGLIAVFLFLLQTYVPFLRYFFEEEPPTITVENIPPGLGMVTKEIKIKATDNRSGLELVRAKLEQSRLNESLFSTTLPWSTTEHEASIKLNAKDLGLRKGNVKITIEAFDRSLQSNGAKYSFELPIRFDTPNIEVLSVQHNANIAGMEEVFFKLKGDNIFKSGVMVGDNFYLAVPAKEFDPDLESVANLYVGFFAVPAEFKDGKESIRIVASNEVGNSSSSSFYYRIRDQKFRRWKYAYSDTTVKQFELIAKLLSDLKSRESLKTRLWKETIPKPDGRETSPRIGDVIVLEGASDTVSNYRNNFYSFRLKSDQAIRTVADGVVVAGKNLGEDVGSYLVVDHGIGFFTLYAGLSNASVKIGDKLVAGEEIGKPGFIPYLGDCGYMYALSFRGTSVRAEEWWDGTWVNDHIMEKSRDIKRRFQVSASLPPLEEEEPVDVKLPVITGLSDLPSRERPKNIITDF